MRRWKLLVLPALAGAIWGATPAAPAQVSVSIGAAPVCPYGYYDPRRTSAHLTATTARSGSAAVSLLEPDHGSMARHDFYGHVDNHYDPHHGYHGPYPAHGEHADPDRMAHHAENFHGSDMRDGRGHEGHPK